MFFFPLFLVSCLYIKQNLIRILWGLTRKPKWFNWPRHHIWSWKLISNRNIYHYKQIKGYNLILVNHFEENKLNWIKLWLGLYNFRLLELLQSTEETGKCRDCGYCTSRRNVLSNSWNSSLPWVFPPATSSQG